MTTIYYSDGTERISEHELKDRYRDFLNKYNELCKIGNLSYFPAQVLEKIDPIAFQRGFSDWQDADGWEEWEEMDDEDEYGEEGDDEPSSLLPSELDLY